MILALLSALALAAPADHPVTLAGGLGATAGPPSIGGYAVGRMVLYPKRGTLGLELAGREGLVTSDARTLGAIGLQGRWSPFANGVFLRGGFVHHHETPYALATAEPMAAALGSLPGIRHRTGGELAIGWDLKIPERALGDRLGLAIDASVAAFPDDNGPPLYMFLEQTWTVDVGRSRAP